MSRKHAARKRNGQRAPHQRQLAWWRRSKTRAEPERSYASLRREWDERWPW